MALKFVVDTSVLTRLRQPSVRDVVEPMASEGELARASISDLEVGFSARSVIEWDKLIAVLDTFERVDVTSDHVRRALQVQRMLARKGKRGRKIPDLLVAAAAERANLGVLHYDADFDHIASVTSQPCSWVVPRGSID